jgi:membrane-associated phospholipid phosphatase
MEWEIRVIEWIQDNLAILGTVFDKIFGFVGGEKGLMVALLIVMFCWRKEVGYRLALVVALTNVWLPMIKAVVLRPRPYMSFPDRVEAKALVDTNASAQDVAAQGYSFPSAHAASVSSLYSMLAQAVKKSWMWIVSIALMLLVGLSRVAAGMHYPTDVLAGWGLGILALVIYNLLEKYISKGWILRLILVASTVPGLFYVRTQDYYTSLGLVLGACLAIPFEQKFVNFQNTRNVFAMILRVAGGGVIYIVLNTLLKLPFDKSFLAEPTLPAFIIRTVRYTIIIFVIIGVYPKVFPLFEKIGKKK